MVLAGEKIWQEKHLRQRSAIFEAGNGIGPFLKLIFLSISHSYQIKTESPGTDHSSIQPDLQAQTTRRTADIEEEGDEFDHIEKLQQLGINAGKCALPEKLCTACNFSVQDFAQQSGCIFEFCLAQGGQANLMKELCSNV